MPYIIRDRGTSDEEQDVYVPTAEEEAMLEQSIAEIERGEYVDWDEVREDFLRRHR
ncbi:MAG TPA: hypothetical protein VND45_00825 [Thermoanaerobaculia bacterium]|jgi:hypothetical protein|nr:hypothetical protein [Thermoanaerobaculia bacterium]